MASRREQVNAAARAQQLEPYPEHAKVFPWSQFEMIELFFDFLASRGVSDLDWGEVRDLILSWRRVDMLAYEAEGTDMRHRYAWLWEQFGIRPEVTVASTLRVTRKSVAEPTPVGERPDGVTFLLNKIRGGE